MSHLRAKTPQEILNEMEANSPRIKFSEQEVLNQNYSYEPYTKYSPQEIANLRAGSVALTNKNEQELIYDNLVAEGTLAATLTAQSKTFYSVQELLTMALDNALTVEDCYGA